MTIKRFRQISEVEAVCFDGSDASLKEIADFAKELIVERNTDNGRPRIYGRSTTREECCFICCVGWWVIRTVDGIYNIADGKKFKEQYEEIIDKKSRVE